MRWHLLNALDKARPLGALDTLLLDVMRALYADTTPKNYMFNWTIWKNVS